MNQTIMVNYIIGGDVLLLEKNLLMTSEGGPPEKKSKRSGESNTCNDPRLQQNDFIW